MGVIRPIQDSTTRAGIIPLVGTTQTVERSRYCLPFFSRSSTIQLLIVEAGVSPDDDLRLTHCYERM